MLDSMVNHGGYGHTRMQGIDTRMDIADPNDLGFEAMDATDSRMQTTNGQPPSQQGPMSARAQW